MATFPDSLQSLFLIYVCSSF
jgi:hypothetical protein